MRTLIVTLPPPGGTANEFAEYDYVLTADGQSVHSAASAAANSSGG